MSGEVIFVSNFGKTESLNLQNAPKQKIRRPDFGCSESKLLVNNITRLPELQLTTFDQMGILLNEISIGIAGMEFASQNVAVVGMTQTSYQFYGGQKCNDSIYFTRTKIRSKKDETIYVTPILL